MAQGQNVSTNVFLLGRPGSGKSTAARHIDMLVRDKGYSTCHINDYTLLLEMFHADKQRPKEERQFSPTHFGGFDVLDFTVLDDVLRRVEQKALKQREKENELVLLEFARGDYREVFEQFDLQFLRSAYFLFFEVNVDICMTRVLERSQYPASDDDHFISEGMLRGYYSTENKSYIEGLFPGRYKIDWDRIRVIENMGDWKEFGNNIKSFIDHIWEKEKQQKQRITEPLNPSVVANIPQLQREELVEIKRID